MVKINKAIKVLLVSAFLPFPANGYQKICFRVEGMVCGKCVAKVEEKFKSNPDIQTILVSLKKEKVEFQIKRSLNLPEVLNSFQALKLKAEPVPCEQ